MALKEVSKKDESVNSAPDRTKKPSLEAQRNRMREKVTGIFHFYEVPGGSMSFSFREFKGDEVQRYDMIDGETYTVPLGVARHLNNNCHYPEHAYFQAEGTKGADSRVMRIAKKIRRVGFQSLEFVDIADLPTVHSQIIEVQTMS